MTKMGKMLVIINLVVALLVAGFLVFDFAIRTNWKQAWEKALEQTEAARANTAAEKKKTRQVQAKLALATKERDDYKKERDEAKVLYQKDLEKQKDIAHDQKTSSTKSDAVASASAAESERMQHEIQMRRQEVLDREKTIRGLQDQVKLYVGRAVASENSVNVLKARLQAMLSQVETMGKKLARLEAGGGTTSVVKSGNAKNPPSVFVRGSVTGIVRDKGLVEVSIGSDDGVNESNTLEVYRLRPKPEYLGTIKILDAHHHKAVGRLLKTPAGIRHSAIVKGDEVASKIMSR
jgi:hypothetical protein